MKEFLTFCSLLVGLTLLSQEKGLSPVTGNGQSATGQTYAVVVGISDYQDEGIPDLRFADKDAEAFAAFLQSPAGGSLDEDHLKVLTNEEATAGQLTSALYWLMDECREGDQAIIYFSGHGDVESNTFSQPGYLLCWDAPAKVYMAGGTLAIPMFQLVVSTLSLEKKAKVVLITDACRAGKLAGSSVNGSELTSSNLAEQFANELKILSCQPDEYSIEGEQWGGGRGAFSYHLVDGLYGLADSNKDLSVTLMEVGRYLQDHVSLEVAPHNQLPMALGNPREILATVNDDLLKKVKERKKLNIPIFTATETKGIEDEVLSLVDSTTRAQYGAFQKALADKSFFDPDTACAEYYFSQLIEEPVLAKLHAGMRRNYAAALQDDAQQVINKYLASDPAICNTSSKWRIAKFGHFPNYLKRAVELLGEAHYMSPLLQARRLWFEGLLLDEEYNLDKTKKHLPELAEAKYKEALAFQPDMILALVELGFVYGYRLSKLDSADLYFERVLELCPNWINGLFLYVQYLQYDKKDMFNAKIWADKMVEIDSTSALTHYVLGEWYAAKKNFPKAKYHLRIASEINSTECSLGSLLRMYFGKGGKESLQDAIWVIEQYRKLDPNTHRTVYRGLIYSKMGQFEEAEKLILETRKKYRPDWNGSYVALFLHYLETGEEGKAMEQFRMAMGKDPKRSAARWLIFWLNKWPGFGDGDTYFRKILEWFPDYPEGHYEYAVFLSGKGQFDAAFQHLETAFAKGFKDFYLIKQEDESYHDHSRLGALRQQINRWNKLMDQYDVSEEFRN